MRKNKKAAIAAAVAKGISFDDFVAYRPMHTYIFLPTREPWPAGSVNAQLPSVALLDDKGEPVLNSKGKPIKIDASAWLDEHRPVHQMTWAPGLPTFIHDQVVDASGGGWTDKPGAICLNLYCPPKLAGGDARKAKPWLDHVHKLFPAEAKHIIQWLAQRVQFPGDKINHALFLGGEQGIGKDAILKPVGYAIGSCNFVDVSPKQTLGRFNGFLKAVILRISEAHDLGEMTRFMLYDHMKVYTAAPPDTLRVDEKNLREHYVINCCGVVITSNHKIDGIYLPADDRRTLVAWSDLTPADFSQEYWKELFGWYDSGGKAHVAAYLAELDISAFDAKAPPPKTPAFWAIVDANRPPEEGELADVIEAMGVPDAFTLAQLIERANPSLQKFLEDRKIRRAIPHRLERVGYTPVRNPGAKSGLWRIDEAKQQFSNGGLGHYAVESVRQAVYAHKELSLHQQLAAVKALSAAATEAAKAKMQSATAARAAKAKTLPRNK